MIYLSTKSSNSTRWLYPMGSSGFASYRQITALQTIPAARSFELPDTMPTCFFQEANDVKFSGIVPTDLGQIPLAIVRAESGYRIGSGDVKLFVDDQNSIIWELTEQPTPILDWLVLGPGMALCHAAKKHYILHSSLVRINGVTIALTGCSGSGKSTMARAVSEHTDGRRFADDGVLVEVQEDGSPGIVGPYPQLKLPNPLESQPEKIDCVVRLEPDAARGAPTISRLQWTEAHQTLIQHTVAAKGFSVPIAKDHFSKMARLARKTPIYALQYPVGLEHLDNQIDMLANLGKRDSWAA